MAEARLSAARATIVPVPSRFNVTEKLLWLDIRIRWGPTTYWFYALMQTAVLIRRLTPASWTDVSVVVLKSSVNLETIAFKPLLCKLTVRLLLLVRRIGLGIVTFRLRD